ncbi:MAG: hypothetical protein J7J91_00945 [Deltaproteobacteria bacterium]|nr:hypothetical protein [Deltaproteobacteria bacterium]
MDLLETTALFTLKNLKKCVQRMSETQKERVLSSLLAYVLAEESDDEKMAEKLKNAALAEINEVLKATKEEKSAEEESEEKSTERKGKKRKVEIY